MNEWRQVKYKGNNTKDKEGRGEGGGKSGGAPCARAEIPYSPWMTCTSADIHYSSETTLHWSRWICLKEQQPIIPGRAYTRADFLVSNFSPWKGPSWSKGKVRMKEQQRGAVIYWAASIPSLLVHLRSLEWRIEIEFGKRGKKRCCFNFCLCFPLHKSVIITLF